MSAGATVIVTGRHAPEEENDNIVFIQADLSTPEGTDKVVEHILKAYNSLDILINNLGGSETQGGGFAVLKDDDWMKTTLFDLTKVGKIYRLNQRIAVIQNRSNR